MNELLNKPNVVGFGKGIVRSAGVDFPDEEAIVILVSRKLPKAALLIDDLIPRAFAGKRTDVIEVGDVRALANTGRHRPIQPSISIGHYKITAGTFGAVVKRRSNGERLILSNNHVLAACFDEETEVLTRDGFKLWKDVSDEDEFATLEPVTNQLEYQKPTELQKYCYEGEMIHFKGKSIDMLVTPSHRMWARLTYKSGLSKHITPNPLKMISAGEIVGDMMRHKSVSYEFKADATWNCTSPKTIALPQAEYRAKDWNVKDPIPLDSWLRFLGRYIADGSAVCNSANNQKFISIRETVPEEIEAICETARECGFSPWACKNGSVVINSKQLYEILAPLGKSKTKYIPREIKDLPPEYLQFFLDSYIEGDGTIDKANQYMLCTASKQLSDDLQEILLKCGFTFTTKMQYGSDYNPDGEYYLIRTKKRPSLRLSTIPKPVDYKGYVYCATVPNGILFTKRNGRSMWSGNSNAGILGDPILQPGTADGGTMKDDTVAELAGFHEIQFGESPPVCPWAQRAANVLNFGARAMGSAHQLVATQINEDAINRMDAAIAKPLDNIEMLSEIPNIGEVVGVRDAFINQQVQKNGRTSEWNTGKVLVIEATISVGYGGGRTATFEDQIITSPLMSPGDSGSLILDMENYAIALGFAGSDQVAIVSPIMYPLNAFDVVLV